MRIAFVRAAVFVASAFVLSLLFPSFFLLEFGFRLVDKLLPTYPGGEPLFWSLGFSIDVCVYAALFAIVTRLVEVLRRRLHRADTYPN